MNNLHNDLVNFINQHSMENGSDTPDFILADYLLGCLAVYEKTTVRRAEWYGGVCMTEQHTALKSQPIDDSNDLDWIETW